MVDEQKKPDDWPKLVRAIVQSVQIDSVRLIESHNSRIMLDDSALPDEVRLKSGLKVKFALNREAKQLKVAISFQLSGSGANEDQVQNIFVIQATFELAYTLKSLDDLEDQHFTAFARMNGVYNAWPYWREYVQSTFSRMGLPPLTLQVLTTQGLRRFVDSLDDGEEENQAKASASV